MDEKIICYLSEIANKAGSLCDDVKVFKDVIIEPNTYEVLGDMKSVVSTIYNLGKAYDLFKFKMFLIGLGKGQISEKDIKKLIKYINNRSKAEFMADTFNKIIISKSKNACCILGLLYHEAVGKNSDISYKQLVIYNALTDLNDIEIDVFYQLFRNMDRETGSVITDSQLEIVMENLSMTKSDIELCMQKLGQLSLVKYDKVYRFTIEDKHLLVETSDYGFTYTISDITNRFYHIVNEFKELC